MEKTKSKKMMSLEQFINKKLARDKKKGKTIDICIDGNDTYMTFTMPTDADHAECVEGASESYEKGLEASVKMIYDCCPMLHNNEAMERAGVEYPYDIVRKTFNNVEITRISNQLIAFYSGEDDGEDKVKNS